MKDFPFDTEKTAYAYVRAEESEYGHLKMFIRLPKLNRYQIGYNCESIFIILSSQIGGQARPAPDPFYAVRITAQGGYDGLQYPEMLAASKVLKGIYKKLENLDQMAGAAPNMVTRVRRLCVAADIEKLYVSPPSAHNIRVPDMMLFSLNQISHLDMAMRDVAALELRLINRYERKKETT